VVSQGKKKEKQLKYWNLESPQPHERKENLKNNLIDGQTQKVCYRSAAVGDLQWI